MPSDALDTAVRSLRDLAPLRVWSLLVTVFGDLVPHMPIDGPTLSALMGRIGIKPEATRVALHRLRSDGWICSEKQGRTSLHRLTAKGQQDSTAATPRIYAKGDPNKRTATLYLTKDTDTDMDPAAFIQIAPRLFIGNAHGSKPTDAMALCPDEFPHWLGQQIAPRPLNAAYGALHSVLTDIDKTLTADTELTPMDIAVLRTMIVHAWRRLVLKHPDLPRPAFGPDWRGDDCRVLVARLLDRFERPTAEDLKAP